MKVTKIEEDALQERGKQHFIGIDRHGTRCPSGRGKCILLNVIALDKMPYRRKPNTVCWELIGTEEDALQERGKHILLELIGIKEDALQERAKQTLFKVVGIEEDALQERAKQNLLGISRHWKKMPYRRDRTEPLSIGIAKHDAVALACICPVVWHLVKN